MKCTVIHTFGREDLYTEVINTEPIHDEDFCDRCGDCLKCYGEDKCVNGGEHFFVRYVQHEEEELGPMIRKLRAELAQSRAWATAWKRIALFHFRYRYYVCAGMHRAWPYYSLKHHDLEPCEYCGGEALGNGHIEHAAWCRNYI